MKITVYVLMSNEDDVEYGLMQFVEVFGTRAQAEQAVPKGRILMPQTSVEDWGKWLVSLPDRRMQAYHCQDYLIIEHTVDVNIHDYKGHRELEDN